ncbi:MAG: prenyltransferase [Holosporales bacterium]|jgi:1,4-dihydroxy-2-naphthoate octaprenyltransferase|nr:prenyltransferase [Holosporales bacterium]
MTKIILYAKVARAHALCISVGPIVCCYLYGRRHFNSSLNTWAFFFVAIAIIFFHLSVNTISEYRDCLKKVDDGNVNGPTYRLAAMPSVRPVCILRLGLVAFSLAVLSGITAVFMSSKFLLIPGIIGAGLALFYSEWPIGYKYKALGEIGVFIAYGPLLVLSCLFSLLNQCSWRNILISIPFGLLTMCILLANNIRDFDFDRGKIKTLPMIIGLKAAYAVLFSAVHLSFMTVPILIYIGSIGKMCLLSLLAYPIIFNTIKRFNSPSFVDVFGVIQAVFCFLLAVGLLL